MISWFEIRRQRISSKWSNQNFIPSNKSVAVWEIFPPKHVQLSNKHEELRIVNKYYSQEVGTRICNFV